MEGQPKADFITNIAQSASSQVLAGQKRGAVDSAPSSSDEPTRKSAKRDSAPQSLMSVENTASLEVTATSLDGTCSRDNDGPNPQDILQLPNGVAQQSVQLKQEDTTDLNPQTPQHGDEITQNHERSCSQDGLPAPFLAVFDWLAQRDTVADKLERELHGLIRENRHLREERKAKTGGNGQTDAGDEALKFQEAHNPSIEKRCTDLEVALAEKQVQYDKLLSQKSQVDQNCEELNVKLREVAAERHSHTKARRIADGEIRPILEKFNVLSSEIRTLTRQQFRGAPFALPTKAEQQEFFFSMAADSEGTQKRYLKMPFEKGDQKKLENRKMLFFEGAIWKKLLREILHSPNLVFNTEVGHAISSIQSEVIGNYKAHVQPVSLHPLTLCPRLRPIQG
jgi:hypothetical protein